MLEQQRRSGASEDWDGCFGTDLPAADPPEQHVEDDLQAWFEHSIAEDNHQGIVCRAVQFGGQRLERQSAKPVEQAMHLLEAGQQVGSDTAGVRHLLERREGVRDGVGHQRALACPAPVQRRAADPRASGYAVESERGVADLSQFAQDRAVDRPLANRSPAAWATRCLQVQPRALPASLRYEVYR